MAYPIDRNINGNNAWKAGGYFGLGGAVPAPIIVLAVAFDTFAKSRRRKA